MKKTLTHTHTTNHSSDNNNTIIYIHDKRNSLISIVAADLKKHKDRKFKLEETSQKVVRKKKKKKKEKK